MEASSSTSSSLRRRAPFRWYCAEKPVLVVSWTADNPGRRFYGCINYWVGRKYKFFQWRDDEICERGKVLILEQRQRIIKLEAEVARCYKREKFYTVALAFLLVICGICLFNLPGSEEFPPIAPLQLLLLCPNLPQALHCLEMPALLLVGSLGSLALFFLGLPGGLLLMGG
ncbi:hypothetical protein SO802_030972 [Lithocarpus litseifolius]|uniref:Zinc finger GRF-type domain-containing protein n=1 Tax=Lithocarpus litseifolius TaxID=425828 RepID=A0AAW2BL29_9ROSI